MLANFLLLLRDWQNKYNSLSQIYRHLLTRTLAGDHAYQAPKILSLGYTCYDKKKFFTVEALIHQSYSLRKKENLPCKNAA
jgi:hypothetical protein